MRIVLLDAGPLGLITNPRPSPERIACNTWLRGLVVRGVQIRVPEIADYEIRRELIRSERWHGIERLDVLATELGYLPLTTETMRRAAEFWAVARQRGRPTASDAAIDADMILCTQAAIATVDGHQVIIATTNVAHLSLFANAGRWQDIR